MAFFDTFSLPHGPTTDSDNCPLDWKWRRDRDHGQVHGGEGWIDAQGTFLSASITTAGYVSWSGKESLRHDHALGYETDEHLWNFSHGRGSYYEGNFDTYNDGNAEVLECSSQFTTGPWARRQTEIEGSRVPLCDIHSGRPSGWYAERSDTCYRRRYRKSREHSPDRSMSEGVGYAPYYGCYAHSTLPVRVDGTSYGERAHPRTKVHAEQDPESSDDIAYPTRGSYSDDDNQISTDIENSSDDDVGEGYGPIGGWRNSEDVSNETNVLPPLDRRCESIVDSETDNDVNMATESNRNWNPPKKPAEAPHVSQQQHRRTDMERDSSLPPAQAHWQYAESSSSSNPSASRSPPSASPRSCHPKHPSVQHEHIRDRSPFEAANSSSTHLPFKRTKLKHQFRQMQKVCRALRSERRRLLRERERLHGERRRLENARI